MKNNVCLTHQPYEKEKNVIAGITLVLLCATYICTFMVPTIRGSLPGALYVCVEKQP